MLLARDVRLMNTAIRDYSVRGTGVAEKGQSWGVCAGIIMGVLRGFFVAGAVIVNVRPPADTVT